MWNTINVDLWNSEENNLKFYEYERENWEKGIALLHNGVYECDSENPYYKELLFSDPVSWLKTGVLTGEVSEERGWGCNGKIVSIVTSKSCEENPSSTPWEEETELPWEGEGEWGTGEWEGEGWDNEWGSEPWDGSGTPQAYKSDDLVYFFCEGWATVKLYKVNRLENTLEEIEWKKPQRGEIEGEIEEQEDLVSYVGTQISTEAVTSKLDEEPTGAKTIGNMVAIAQEDFDTAKTASTLVATTFYLVHED